MLPVKTGGKDTVEVRAPYLENPEMLVRLFSKTSESPGRSQC